MKTSNKLLLGMLVAVMLGISTFVGFAKYHAVPNDAVLTPITQETSEGKIELRSE